MDDERSLEVVVPGLVAADREGLDLTVTRLEASDANKLLLEVDTGGSAILELGAEEGFFVFAHGKARLVSTSTDSGRAFVDAVAGWLNHEPDPAQTGDESTPTAVTTCSWVRLGTGQDAIGTSWSAFKLFFDQGELHAEVFFRLSEDGRRAQFLEKWSEYRERLLAIFDRALGGAPARRWRARSSPRIIAPGRRSFGEEDAFEACVPEGWNVSWRQEGHWRIADANDEMMIEMSCLHLPPLPPEAPDVPARLRDLIDGSEHRAEASPIVTFMRGETTISWSEYAFLSKDTKRPESAKSPARGRWLIAANRWVQVLITACWWEADIAEAEQAWTSVVDSLHLAGRISERLQPKGSA